LIDDKKGMSEKCEKLVKELKTIDKKYQDKVKTMDDRYVGQDLNIDLIIHLQKCCRSIVFLAKLIWLLSLTCIFS
jgi:hypothetical protein